MLLHICRGIEVMKGTITTGNIADLSYTLTCLPSR